MMLDDAIVFTAMILAFVATLNLSFSIRFSDASFYEHYAANLINTTELSLRPGSSFVYFFPTPISIYDSAIGEYSTSAEGSCGGTCIVILKTSDNVVRVITCDS